MLKNHTFKLILTVLSLLFIISANSIAGTTGKIAGKVIDATTGEPLIGANVIIMGTTLGAATDFNGNYFIINIPPGKYQVKASLVGYNSIITQNVKVSVDQTTSLDFKLHEEAVEMSDVVIVATRPIVQKDLTSTQSNISGDDINMLPLEDVQAVVNLQAGVVNGHFRGGRLGEVQYLVDGVSTNDVFTGLPSMQAEVNSIAEVQVITGTFNAEYGDALSGVVNQITKLAEDNYDFNFSGYSGDYVSNRKDIFDNIGSISPTGVYNLQGTFSGPVPGVGDLFKFFISGRYFRDEGYIYGQRIFNPSDSSDFSANNPADWFIGATGDKAFIPMAFNDRLSLQAKLEIKVGTGRGIVLNGLYLDQKFRSYNHLYKLNPDGDYKKFNKSYLLSAQYTHVFSNSTFLNLLASAFISDYSQYVYKNPLDPRYVNPARKKDVSGNAFLTGGTENWHFYHTTNTYTAKIDLTTQLSQQHQIKTGIEFKYHNVEYKDFQIVIDASTGFKPYIPAPGSFNNNIYNANPYQAAAYVQDKIELDYLIVNVGLRFDYFQPDGKYILNPNNIAVLDELMPPFPDSLLGVASAKYQFSPRLGISYPITDKGVIHISYGHFFQIPPFEYLYRNPNFRVPLTGDFPANIGNTIGNTDLKPQMTVMYEIGLQQQLFDDYGVTITGYLKDIRNLLGSEIHIKNEFRKFSKLINIDYGSVKGITLSFEKRFSNGFSATIDYTYQDAKGNASDPNDAFDKAQANPPIEVNKQLVPLDWDRTHSLNFTVTAGVPGDYIISTIGRWGTGLPYTPSIQNQRTGLENSDNRPSIFNMDLFLTKFFTIYNQQFSVFLKVYNLLDNANELEVFSDTGRAGYTLELTRAQTAPRGVNTLKEFFTRPDFYSSPRQIVLGASLEL
ncbi:MAG TPA: TonB-dependent receptor [Ignavibacteriales bacterium]|nr:TonB-dependent receptor [Ignavibacteriales bacterium]